MYQVYIRRILNQFVLTIETTEQIVYAYPAQTVLDVLDVACTMQLHIDNLNDLTFETMSELYTFTKGIENETNQFETAS